MLAKFVSFRVFYYNLYILSYLCLYAVSSIGRSDEKELSDSVLDYFSHKHSIVFGPGIEADIVLPVQYFFIQGVNTDGKNLTSSPPGELSVKVSGLHQRCRIWTQLFNRQDGSFIARYKLYHPCNGIHIDITYNGKPVGKSPYIIKKILLHEYCYCPKALTKWLESMKCPSTYDQIEEDLKPFSEINMTVTMEDAVKRFNVPGAYSFCHYVIIANEIHRKCYGQYVGFSMFMDEMLLSLARKVQLPNVEMLVNLGDWPLEHKKKSDDPLPILSWCGSKDTRDIVMPTYDLTESTLEMMGRVTLDMLSVQGNSGPSWENKTEKGFWRGRDSRRERLDLVKLGSKNPDLIDAALTNFFFFRNEEHEYGPKAEHISFFDFFQYKYQINIDGTVAAYRLPYLLAGNSIVLKQDSDYYEFFYNQLYPYEHYIPFNRNLSNLVEQLNWAIENDEAAKKISQKAQEFSLNHLMPQNIFCYYAVLLQKYSKLLKNAPSVLEEMELVPQPINQATCQCPELQGGSNKVLDEL